MLFCFSLRIPMLVLSFIHVCFKCIICCYCCNVAGVFSGFMDISNACTCLALRIHMFFSIVRWCGCAMFTFCFVGSSDRSCNAFGFVGINVHCVVAFVRPQHLKLQEVFAPWTPTINSTQFNLHLRLVLVLWSIMLIVHQFYESFGRTPGWRFTARCTFYTEELFGNVDFSMSTT